MGFALFRPSSAQSLLLAAGLQLVEGKIELDSSKVASALYLPVDPTGTFVFGITLDGS